MKTIAPLTALLAAVVLASTSAHADILRVPADFPTIQAAVDAAESGDTIQLAPGEYHEAVVASNLSLTFTAAAPGVLWSASDADHALLFLAPEHHVEISGITFANSATRLAPVRTEAMSAVIRHCDFINNNAAGPDAFGNNAGALRVGRTWRPGGSAIIENCTFESNLGNDVGALWIVADIPSDPMFVEVRDCHFARNRALSVFGVGAGALGVSGTIIAPTGVSIQIVNTSFVDNAGETGGAFRANGFVGLTLDGCSFERNNAAFAGGAVSLSPGGSQPLVISKCIFRDNASPLGTAITASLFFLYIEIRDTQICGKDESLVFFQSQPTLTGSTTISPPCCPADLNGDRLVDQADLDRLLTDIATNHPAADRNTDGLINGADFNTWLTDAAAPCR